MAGALIHIAMGNPHKLNQTNEKYSKSFKKAYAIGLLLPDIAKNGLIATEEDFNRYFNGCNKNDILTYEQFLKYKKNNHFNPNKTNPEIQDTSDPNLKVFISTSYVDFNKPIWQGVLCHLIGDKVFYYKDYCVNRNKALEDYKKEVGELEKWNQEKWLNSETSKIWYDDYNVLNTNIENKFKLIEKLKIIMSEELLNEILKGFKVEFSSERKEPRYMNLTNIIKYSYYSRFLARHTDKKNIERILEFFDERDKDVKDKL